MKVQVTNGANEVIWEREENAGMTSRAYVTDGTQEKIIAALENALEQAKGELATFSE